MFLGPKSILQASETERDVLASTCVCVYTDASRCNNRGDTSHPHPPITEGPGPNHRTVAHKRNTTCTLFIWWFASAHALIYLSLSHHSDRFPCFLRQICSQVACRFLHCLYSSIIWVFSTVRESFCQESFQYTAVLYDSFLTPDFKHGFFRLTSHIIITIKYKMPEMECEKITNEKHRRHVIIEHDYNQLKTIN